MATVTKKDLAQRIAADWGCSRAQASKVLDTLFHDMREQLIAGHRIEIRGFAVLEVRNTKPRATARNPSTGERVFVPARRKAHFKPGRQLKQALNEPSGP